MNSYFWSVCSLLLMFSQGCTTVPVENGKLPITHATKLKNVVGVYSGKMSIATKNKNMSKPHLEQLSLKLEISENGILSVYFSEDWLGKNCEMKVGKLIEFHSFDEKDAAHFEASFEFDPGKCLKLVTSDAPSLILVSSREQADGVRIETYLSREYLGMTTQLRGRRTLHYYGEFFKVQKPTE